MKTKLVGRLEDIPGVASVDVDLEDSETGGINVRLQPDADEREVLERVRALLVAYGVRSQTPPRLRVGRGRLASLKDVLGVDVKITPVKGGARVEVIGDKLRSFRVVPPDPTAIAQGMADAWCQVIGMIPVEILKVSVGERGQLIIIASDGKTHRVGHAPISEGWSDALALAVGIAIGVVSEDNQREHAGSASTPW